MSEAEIIQAIAEASIRGNLGFFVGTGLSIALTEKSPLESDRAPRFEELLERMADRLELQVRPRELKGRGLSFPQMASRMMDEARDRGTPEQLKETVAALCNFVPREAERRRYRRRFAALTPSWFVTTNYDFLLEMVVDRAYAVHPREVIVSGDGRVPVYHLHGHRYDPESIVVTEEDYVALMSPTDYRYWKLAMLMAESTTVMLGYSLGDINVKVAHSLSRTFARNGDSGALFQIAYARQRTPREPRRTPEGVHLLEVSDLPTFLGRVAAARAALVETAARQLRELEEAFSEENSLLFRLDPGLFREVIELSARRSGQVPADRIIALMSRHLAPIWREARGASGWRYYDRFLQLLLHILEGLDLPSLHPAVGRFLVDELVRLGAWLEPKPRKDRGMAWEASRTWKRGKERLPLSTRRELLARARQQGDAKLIELFDCSSHEVRVNQRLSRSTP